jgi:hypothetical protein
MGSFFSVQGQHQLAASQNAPATLKTRLRPKRRPAGGTGAAQSRRFSATWLRSACQRWGLVKKACIIDLLDKEVRDVSARDKPRAPVARIDKHVICPCSRSSGQNGRTNDSPVETAPAYHPLLRILVGVNTPKEQRQDGIVEQSSMATAVAGSQAGDGNQALDRPRLHRINEDTSGDREQARSAEDQLRRRRNTKRLNDRGNACQRTFDHMLVKRIAIQFLKLGIA